MNKLRLFLISIFILTTTLLKAQSFVYSYTDPCTGLVKSMNVPTNGITVTYFGQIQTFNPTDFENGVFDQWAYNVYNSYGNQNPCGSIFGVSSAVDIAQGTALNFISVINNISALSDLQSSMTGGGSLNTMSVVESAKSSSNKKDKKDKKSNQSGEQSGGDISQNNTNGTNSNQSGSNNSSGQNTGNQSTSGQNPGESNNNQSGSNNSSSSNGEGSNQNGGNSQTNGSEQQSNNTSNTTGNNSGNNESNGGNGSQNPENTNNTNQSSENQSNEQSGSTPNNESQGSENQLPTGESGGNGNNGSNGSNGESNNQTPEGNENLPEDKEEGKTNFLGGTVNSTQRSTEANKPQIVLSSDFAGFNFKNNDVTFGGKGTAGYTSLSWDGRKSYGVLLDYTSLIKGPNVTGFYANIAKRRIDLLSLSGTISFQGRGSQYATLAVGQMWSFPKVKSLKAIYLATASFGNVYGERFLGTAFIAGGMYDWKISKRIDIKMMNLFIYAPYVSYYNDILLKSPYVIMPILGTNIGITKKFKFNVNFGGAYAINENIMNFTLMFGTRFAL